jgi:hypothetical protein
VFAPAFTEEAIALSITVLTSAPDLSAVLTADEIAELMLPSACAVLLIAVEIAVFASAPAFNELLTLIDVGLDEESATAVTDAGEDNDPVSVAPAALPNANDAARLALANWFLMPSRIERWLSGF